MVKNTEQQKSKNTKSIKNKTDKPFLQQFVKSNEIVKGDSDNEESVQAPVKQPKRKVSSDKTAPPRKKSVEEPKVEVAEPAKKKKMKKAEKAKKESIESSDAEEPAKKVVEPVKKKKVEKSKKESVELSDVEEPQGMETLFSKRPAIADKHNKETSNGANKKVKGDSTKESNGKGNNSKPKTDKKFVDEPAFEVYISGLPTEADAEVVYQHFQNCGRIKDVKLQYASDGTPKKKGFLKFETEQARDNALKLNKSIMISKRINVERVFDSAVKRPEGEFKPPVSTNTRESRSIIVRNLPFGFNEDDLYKLFNGCGEIVKHRIIRNETGQSRGFGFVDFTEIEAASLALEKNNTRIQDRPVYVEYTAPKEYPDRPERPDNNFQPRRDFSRGNHRVNDNRYINENRRGYMVKSFQGEVVDL